MFAFIIRRTLQAIPVVIGITFIAFFVMWAAPGTAASALTIDPNLNSRQRQAIAEAMGVNDPFLVQYARWMIGDAPIEVAGVTLYPGRQIPIIDKRGMETGTRIGTNRGIIRGDFGRSLISKKDTLEVLGNRLRPTIELGAASLLLGFLIGIPTGVLAAVKQGSWFDQITRVASVIVSSVPVFWLGLILLLVFGSYLGWLPMGNNRPISISGDYTIWQVLPHYILPIFTLSSFSIASFSRYMRASVLEVLSQDYIRTARAKGLNDPSVWFTHATRNALIPIATLLGAAIPGILAGAVLTETIYAWPGMGTLVVESVEQQDYPVIMAIVLMFSISTVVGYLISDVLYALLDPRIRLA